MRKKSILKVGLTGGMGCGKSAVRRMLGQLGVPTIDADTLAKEIAMQNPEAIAEIKKTFGPEMYDKTGILQRTRLAAKVFGKPRELEKLNQIIHPKVIAVVDQKISNLEQKGQPIVVIEAALFFEVGWDKAMDRMVVVTAPLAKRLKWLGQRDGLTEKQMKARMSHQLPVEDKVKRANFVIYNDGTLDDLLGKVEQLKAWLWEQVQG